MKEINSTELKTSLDEGKTPVLLDVREDWEYRLCHLENSVHIPMGDIPGRISELCKNDEIIVICHHGARSLQVAWFLESQDFANVVNLSGGVDAWASTVDASMHRY